MTFSLNRLPHDKPVASGPTTVIDASPMIPTATEAIASLVASRSAVQELGTPVVVVGAIDDAIVALARSIPTLIGPIFEIKGSGWTEP